MKPLFRVLGAALALCLFSQAAQAEPAKLSGALVVRIKGDVQISPDDIREAVKHAGFEAIEIGSVIRSAQAR